MIAAADTGPLNYLIQLELIHLLPRLYDQVTIPKAVAAELQAPNAPAAVRSWAQNPPPWLDVVQVEPASHSSTDLHLGEREAIALALLNECDVLLIDELAGRTEAQRLGLSIAGTLALLLQFARLSLVDLPRTLQSLRQLGFYFSSSLEDCLLESFHRPA